MDRKDVFGAGATLIWGAGAAGSAAAPARRDYVPG